MVFTVRCFKCGENDVRLIMGGRSIIHARCHSCEANLLDEVMQFEEHACGDEPVPPPEEPKTATNVPSLAAESSTLEEDTQAVGQS